MAGKVVWLSGASSGLGKAAALALHQDGWQVVAGARSFVDAPDRADGITRLPLDVRDETSVTSFCQRARELHGSPDALVNAAGILIMGPAEETSLTEYQAVLDTILLGTIRLTQQALPLMREKGQGKIIILSSVNGLMPTPFQSAYVAAKHALEGYAECLLLETRRLGIQVMIVEPGDHRGGSMKYRAGAQTVSPVYRDSFDRVRKVVSGDEENGGQPSAFGTKLVKVMNRRRLPTRMRATTLKETAAIVLHDILPGGLFARFLADYYQV